MVNWPANIRFLPVGDSYSEELEDTLQRTAMDTGPDKTRPRSTAAPELVSFTLPRMTKAEYVQLKAWFKDDLRRGALPFTAIHPITLAQETFRFAAPLSGNKVGKSMVVALQLKVLP